MSYLRHGPLTSRLLVLIVLVAVTIGAVHLAHGKTLTGPPYITKVSQQESARVMAAQIAVTTVASDVDDPTKLATDSKNLQDTAQKLADEQRATDFNSQLATKFSQLAIAAGAVRAQGTVQERYADVGQLSSISEQLLPLITVDLPPNSEYYPSK